MSIELFDRRGKIVKAFTSLKEAYSYAKNKNLEEFSIYTHLILK